ncbi:MAG: hypothetical protein Q4D57_01600 [Clostridia bacterium]|nr:hypothetical protein [Clostridia bacterium]
MNETEKRAFEVLGEEEQQKIAGGVKEDEALTSEQCQKLRIAVSQLSEEDQIKIADGKDAHKIKIPGIISRASMVAIGYGAPPLLQAIPPINREWLEKLNPEKKNKPIKEEKNNL